MVACLATISFRDEDKYAKVEGHNQPIYISRTFGNKPISRLVVNNWLAVGNPIVNTFINWATVDQLKHTSTIIEGLNQSEQRSLKKLP